MYKRQTLIRRGLPTRTTMGAMFGCGGVLLLPVVIATGASIVTSPVSYTHLTLPTIYPV